jgi:adenylosuccinate synthase
VPICVHCADSGFHHCEPVYKALPGWEETLDEVAEVSELPSGARAYIEFVEEQLGV